MRVCVWESGGERVCVCNIWGGVCVCVSATVCVRVSASVCEGRVCVRGGGGRKDRGV